MEMRLRHEGEGAQNRFRRLRRMCDPAAKDSLAREAQLLHKLVHNNLMGPQRPRYGGGRVSVLPPVGRRSNILQRAVKTKRYKGGLQFVVYIDQKIAKCALAIERGWRSMVMRAPTARGKKAFAWVTRGRRPHGSNKAGWAQARKQGRAVVVKRYTRPARHGTWFYEGARRRFAAGHIRRLKHLMLKWIRRAWQ